MRGTQPSPFAQPPPQAAPPPEREKGPGPPPFAACAVIPAGGPVKAAVLKAAAQGRLFTGDGVLATTASLRTALAALDPGDALLVWKLPARHRRAALSPEQDARIAALLAEGVPPAAVAARFGVDVTTARRAARRHTGQPPGRPGHPPGLTPQQAAQVKARHDGGESWKALAAEYGVARVTLRRAVERLEREGRS